MQRRDEAMRSRVREKMRQQESGGGDRHRDVPDDKRLELKDNQKEKGICIKRLDFIPYIVSNAPGFKAGEIDEWRNYGEHRNVGPDLVTVICLKETYNLPCPICEAQKIAYKAAETEAEKKEASAMYVKKRSLFNVIDLDEEDKGIQVLDISWHLFGKQMKEELDTAPDYKYDTFNALKGGFTVRVRFNQKQFGDTKYYEAKRIDFEERDDYTEEALKEGNDLDSFLKPKTYEELENILAGRSSTPQENKTENKKEEAPVKARSLRAPKKEGETPVEVTTREVFNEAAPAKRTLARRNTVKEASKVPVCPGKGEFGVDTDTLDACQECKIWEDCGKAYDESK